MDCAYGAWTNRGTKGTTGNDPAHDPPPRYLRPGPATPPAAHTRSNHHRPAAAGRVSAHSLVNCTGPWLRGVHARRAVCPSLAYFLSRLSSIVSSGVS